MVKSSLQSIIDQYPVFKEMDNGKLVCTVTKHELPISQIENYVQSKKFLAMWSVYEVMHVYGEHFQEMPNGVLACDLTKRTVARNGKALKNHVNGTRFKKALEEAKLKAVKEIIEAAKVEANESMDYKSEANDENIETKYDDGAETIEDVKEENKFKKIKRTPLKRTSSGVVKAASKKVQTLINRKSK